MRKTQKIDSNIRAINCSEGRGIIYSLSDPISGHIRYVGKSTNPRIRYYSHLEQANRYLRKIEKEKSYKLNWLKGLLVKNLFPILEVLEETSEDLLNSAEIYWMHQISAWGFSLTNSHFLSSGTSSKEWKIYLSDTKVKTKIGEAQKKLWASENSVHRSEDTMSKRVASLKEAWKDPNSKYHSEECKLKHSTKHKAAWANPESKLRSEACTKLRSESAKNSWLNPIAKHHDRKKSIFSENPFTGEIRYYESIAYAGRCIGIHPSKILNNINYIGKSKNKMKNFHPDGPFCFYKTDGNRTHPFIERELNGRP